MRRLASFARHASCALQALSQMRASPLLPGLAWYSSACAMITCTSSFAVAK